MDVSITEKGMSGCADKWLSSLYFVNSAGVKNVATSALFEKVKDEAALKTYRFKVSDIAKV
jgi:hypothetical protein